MIRIVTAYGVNVDFIGILFSELRSPSFQNTKINGNISELYQFYRYIAAPFPLRTYSFIANAESPVILRDTARREGIIPSIAGTE